MLRFFKFQNFITIRSTFPTVALGDACLARWKRDFKKWLPCSITGIRSENTEEGRDSNQYRINYDRNFEEAVLSGEKMAHINVFDITLPKGYLQINSY